MTKADFIDKYTWIKDGRFPKGTTLTTFLNDLDSVLKTEREECAKKAEFWLFDDTKGLHRGMVNYYIKRIAESIR